MTDRSTGAGTREGTRADEAAAGSIEAVPAPPVVGSADGGADRADRAGHRQPSPRTVGGAGPTLVVTDRAKSGALQECIEKALVSASGAGGQDAGREGEQQGPRDHQPGDHQQHQQQQHQQQQQRDHQEPRHQEQQLLQISNLRPDDIHVLVVDDEMMSRTVVSTLLKKFKYTVTTAEDGAEAMELLKSSPPGTYHLVLTDVRMPKLNGIELLQYIRSEETLRSVPVVMMSGYDGEDVVGACEQGGAEEYLVKPVGAQEVANIWHHVLKKRGEATTVPQSAAGCEVAATVDAGRTDGDPSPFVPARPVAAKSVAPPMRPLCAPNKPRQCQLSSAHNGDVALIWDPSRRVRGSSRARKVTFSSLARFGFLATFLLYAARLQRGPRPARPGAPLPTPALRPCSSAPQNPPQPMHRPARPLIAPLCRAGDAR